jgi:hypothetical protein
MNFFEFLNDVHLRASKLPIIDFYDPNFVTFELNKNKDGLSVSSMSPLKDVFVHGVYKTRPPHTKFKMPDQFCLTMDDSYFESLHDIDLVEKDGKIGIIHCQTESSNTFHKLPADVFCINLRDHISNFSPADFSVKFDADEVKQIVQQFDIKSIVDQKLGYHQSKSNLLYFRRNSKGKIFLEVCDHQHSHSVHTDHSVDEETLHFPIRVKIRDFIYILKICSKNNRPITIDGKGFSTESQDSWLKLTDEDSLARYEYWLPCQHRNYY